MQREGETKEEKICEFGESLIHRKKKRRKAKERKEIKVSASSPVRELVETSKMARASSSLPKDQRTK